MTDLKLILESALHDGLEAVKKAADMEAVEEIRVGFLDALEMAEMREHAFFGMGANRAGIHKQYISINSLVCKFKTFVDKRRSNKRRVQLIHLATKILNMQFHKYITQNY